MGEARKMLLEHARVLILDDEEEALLQSKRALSEFVPEAQIICCMDAVKALNEIADEKVELLFLDVEMPGANGFELSDYIRKMKPNMEYVFLTGHTELGEESYEHEPLGFLTKPINRVRLEHTLERYLAKKKGNAKKGRIAVDTGTSGFVLIHPGDILYIAREGRRTVIHCTDRNYSVKYSLETLELMLEEDDFFRTHQSVLAPLSHIAQVRQADFGKTFCAVLDDGTKLPVSRNSYARLREHLLARGVRFM